MRLHPAVQIALLPLSWIYGAVVVARAWLYRRGILKQKRLNGVVISVGNLTVGGAGKTPMVFTLAQRLLDRGKKVGILSRGYRGRTRTDEHLPALDSAENDSVPLVLSDETWMMERHFGGKVHLGVGADRYAHGQALQQKGIDWFLLDDGFQHLQLARDVDIVLVDATDPFGDGHLLPTGRLREPKSALKRADMLVITRAEHAPAVESVLRRHTRAPIFYARPDLKEVCPGENSRVQAVPNGWLGRKMFAFCAIGNSRSFFEDVRQWGMEIVGQRAFPDHYRYTAADAADIEGLATAAGAEALLCTDKDTYNLKGVWFQKLPLYTCRINMKVFDPGNFWPTLYEIIKRKRAGAAP